MLPERIIVKNLNLTAIFLNEEIKELILTSITARCGCRASLRRLNPRPLSPAPT